MRIQRDDEDLRVPVEDLALVLLDSPEVSITSALLSEMANRGVALLSTGGNHHPNGLFLPLTPHSRPLKVLNRQLALGRPRKKRLWQQIIQRKLSNQAECLVLSGQERTAAVVRNLIPRVRSGDPANIEAQGSRLYFPALFGGGFTRGADTHINSALNYGYTVVRAAIARSQVRYGLLTPIGLHHCNEQNAFNLTDDLIEPFRPVVDQHVFRHFGMYNPCTAGFDLTREDKGSLVSLLHEDIDVSTQDDTTCRCTVLAAIDRSTESLCRTLFMEREAVPLELPLIVRS